MGATTSRGALAQRSTHKACAARPVQSIRSARWRKFTCSGVFFSPKRFASLAKTRYINTFAQRNAEILRENPRDFRENPAFTRLFFSARRF
jgi:hypothetical protein